MFSTASLKFGDSWENFGRWKKQQQQTSKTKQKNKTSFSLEIASFWQIFFRKRNKILRSVNRVLFWSHLAG